MNDESFSSEDPAAASMAVQSTGFAFVEEGERIVPAPNSEAVLQSSRGGEAVAQYVFPVEIEVLSPPEAADPGEIVDLALERLAAGLEVA